MKFKSGDRVAVYDGYDDRRVGTVEKIMYSNGKHGEMKEDHILVKFSPDDDGYDYKSIHHVKQCRKLVKKKQIL